MDISKREKELQAQEKAALDGISDIDLAKASQAASIVVDAVYDSIDGISVPKDRQEWIEIYKKHVWAYAGIFAIASTIAKLPRMLVEVNRETGDREEKRNHELLNLIDYPNPVTTGYDWLEREVIHLESCGNAYTEIVRGTEETRQAGKTVKATEKPTELWAIRPDMLTPVPAKDGNGLAHWIFQVKKWGKKKIFQVDEILPFGYTDPTQVLFGLGSLQPALDDLRQDVAMAAWNLDFFENGLTPQGVFQTDQTLQPKQAEDIADQVKDFLLGGRRVLILGRGMKWQTISVDPKDVDFANGRSDNREAILAGLGVPPVKVGLLEHAKYDNYRLQAEAFHQDTILPKLRKIEGGINLFLVPQYPELARTPEKDFRFEFDTTELLAKDEDKLTDRVIKKLRSGLLTINAALGELGHEAVEDDEIGEMRMIDKGLIPLGELSMNGMNSLEAAENEVEDIMRRHDEDLPDKVEEIVRKALERNSDE